MRNDAKVKGPELFSSAGKFIDGEREHISLSSYIVYNHTAMFTLFLDPLCKHGRLLGERLVGIDWKNHPILPIIKSLQHWSLMSINVRSKDTCALHPIQWIHPLDSLPHFFDSNFPIFVH